MSAFLQSLERIKKFSLAKMLQTETDRFLSLETNQSKNESVFTASIMIKRLGTPSEQAFG